MIFPLNSNNLRILPDDSGYSIGAHFYLLVMSWKIKKHLCSYYVNLDISQEINGREDKMANKRKWEINLNFMR